MKNTQPASRTQPTNAHNTAQPDDLERNIKLIQSDVHGTGVVASRNLVAGQLIIEYRGEKVTRAVSSKRQRALYEAHLEHGTAACYTFTLNSRYDLDGDAGHNPAKYINHTCQPNAHSEIIDGKVWIVASHTIKRGEAIGYNYGYSFDPGSYWENPCWCGTSRCVGYIVAEDQWGALRAHQLREMRSCLAALSPGGEGELTDTLRWCPWEWLVYEVDPATPHINCGRAGATINVEWSRRVRSCLCLPLHHMYEPHIKPIPKGTWVPMSERSFLKYNPFLRSASINDWRRYA